MAEKIRVAIDKVELEVNDNGDIIILPVSDERFIKRMYDFATAIQKKSEALNFIDDNNTEAIINGDIELHEDIKTGFDELFGSGAYTKVFGTDIVVGAEYVMDFINQCSPYIQKHMDERSKRLKKYSADRTGSSL